MWSLMNEDEEVQTYPAQRPAETLAYRVCLGARTGA